MTPPAIRREHDGVSVHTAEVTRPRTGYPFLDAGLEQPGAVLAFAHRGGAFHPEIEGLENTLAAFEHAVALGYSYLETDVQATRDGVVLAFHDAQLDRVTGTRGAVADLTRADVSTALIGGRESIPALEELLEHLPAARFNVDIKSTAAVAPLAELVRRTGSHDRVCVGSFSERRLRTFRRLAGPKVATSIGVLGIAAHTWLPVPPLPALLRGPGAAFQVPRHNRGVRIVDEAFVRRAHERDIPVHVWTIDDPQEMHELLDMGVDGMMTDRTDLLRGVLLERGQWMGAAR